MTQSTISPRELETRVAGDPVASRRLLRYLDDLGFRIRRPTTIAFAALLWGEPGWSEVDAKTASKRWRDARATGELPTATLRLICAVCWPRELAEVWTAGYLAGQRAAAEGPQANPYAQAEPIPGYPRKAPA